MSMSVRDGVMTSGRTQTQVTATIPELIERARALGGSGRRSILGITGAPGAGKSTLAAALQGALADSVQVVPMDGFHLSNEVLADLGRRQRKGALDTFDVDGYVALLERLHAVQDDVVYAPSFDRVLETAVAGVIPVPRSVPLVITEGNYLLHDSDSWERVSPLLDEVWFVDVPPSERVRRLVSRRAVSGESLDEATSWVHGVDQANADVVTPTAARADVILTLASQAAVTTTDGERS